jgi:hypothetical protein
MVAIKVTSWLTVDPAGDGNDDDRVTLVVDVTTDWASPVAAEALPLKFKLPGVGV